MWPALTATGVVSPRYLPSPGAVVRAFGRLASGGELWSDLRATLTRVVIGFALVVAISVPLGLAMGTWPRPGPCSSR